MIIGVYDGKFAYIAYSEYRKLKVDATSSEQTFPITIVEEKDNDYIKKIVGR